MAKIIEPVPAVFNGDAQNRDINGGNSTLNSPEVDEKSGKPTQRAITTAAQAHSIAKNLRDKAKRGRIKTAAIIADKYNGSAPFKEADLSRTGQTWRNNFSTNFLASIIDRVKPQMLDPINKSDVLTHSALNSTFVEGASKSRTFCEVTTKVIRRWPGWRDFASQLSQENVLFGHAIPAWIDNRQEWRPYLWRYDEAYLPEGVGQHASKVQVACFYQKMLLHDFIKLFEDKKIAVKACYNVPNCIKAANSTMNNGREIDETELAKEDRLREGGDIASSYSSEAKTVNMFHVVVQDYTGEVDLWTVSENDGWELRNVQNIQDEMPDALTLFTFQSGNGKFYGSKGLGRLLTNIHIAIERGRCLGADQMYLSGLVIFQSDKKDAASLQARVRHPFVFVANDMKVVSEQIEFHTEAFEAMDQKLSHLAESIAGAFIPPNLNEQGANTKIEAAQNAEREAAVKEGVLGRFFDHLSDLISAMQRKIYSPINLREGKRAYDNKIAKQQTGVRVLVRKVYVLLTAAFGPSKGKAEPDIPENSVADEEAVSAVVELLEAGLNLEEIATLALSPSAQSNATDGAGRDQATLQYIAANRANPFIDQSAATDMEANIAIGEDRAAQLIIKRADPQVEAIAIREQEIEIAMMAMTPPKIMPVAASDKHDTHRAVLASAISDIIPAVTGPAPTDALCVTAQQFIAHYQSHVQLDQTMPPDMKASEMKATQADLQSVTKVQAMLQKQAQALAEANGGAPVDPSSLPVPVPGQPPQVGPNGQIVGEDPNVRQSIHPEDAKLKIEIDKQRQVDERIALEKNAQALQASKLAHEQKMDHANLAIKTSQIAHQQQLDAAKLQQDNAGILQESMHAGASDAVSQAQMAHDAELAKAQQAHEKDAATMQAQFSQDQQESDQEAQANLAKLASANDPANSTGQQQ